MYDDSIPLPSNCASSKYENEEIERTSHQNGNNKQLKSIKLILKPRCDKKKLKDSIGSFTSINLDITSISWTRFNAIDSNWKNGIEITDWKFNNISTISNEHICDLIKIISRAIDEIPSSDIYIIEESSKAQHFRKMLKPNSISEIVQINQLNAIIVTLLQKRMVKQTEITNNVYFLGQSIVGRLHNLYIGNETVSTHSIIKDILRSKRQQENTNIQFNIEFDENVRKTYFDSKAINQEFMGKSMLIGLTFYRLALFV